MDLQRTSLGYVVKWSQPCEPSWPPWLVYGDEERLRIADRRLHSAVSFAGGGPEGSGD